MDEGRWIVQSVLIFSEELSFEATGQWTMTPRKVKTNGLIIKAIWKREPNCCSSESCRLPLLFLCCEKTKGTMLWK